MDATLPPNFLYLQNALSVSKGQKQLNLIGVCVDFLPGLKSKGPDYTIKFTLHDQSWEKGLGVSCRFFSGKIESLPDIRDQGDVVILRNVNIKVIHGETVVLSKPNSASSAFVLPYAQLQQMTTPEELKDHVRYPAASATKIHPTIDKTLPSTDELRYAIWISKHECSSAWKSLPPATAVQGLHPPNPAIPVHGLRPPKFRLIEQLEIPVGASSTYADLLGEVRRTYAQNDKRVELSITDYTTHKDLFDHRYENNPDCRDGDPYGYIKSTSAQWPGPWGKMTITVTLWDENAEYATTNITEGKYVYLRNVQIKMDRNGLKLEGNSRPDHGRPNKLGIEIKNPREERDDDQLKELLSRRLEYEKKAKSKNMPFPGDVPTSETQPKDGGSEREEQSKSKKTREGGSEREEERESKSKKTRGRNRKRQKSRVESDQKSEDAPAVPGGAIMKSNSNVTCNNHPVSCKTILEILDTGNLERTTPGGNSFRFPFQNCTYKAKVRVVDFFPDNIADFAAPRRVTDYDILSDVENDKDDDSDVDVAPAKGEEVVWEWRFFLLVEDSQPQRGARDGPAHMELLVAESDGDFLLRMDACDLRDRENAQHLATLKEKLFILWGDLLEKKEEPNSANALAAAKPSARPFECLIKEYGVAARDASEEPKDSMGYNRMFRLFGTTII